MFWCCKTLNLDNTALSFLPQRSKSVVGVLGDVLPLNDGVASALSSLALRFILPPLTPGPR